MIKAASFIFLFTIANFTAHSQSAYSNGRDLITWNEYYKLQWHDFEGEPDENRNGDAGSVVQIKAKPYLVKKKVMYDVEAIFNKKKSWARGQSPTLLAHEQVHFDIAEVYARKIRKKIIDISKRNVDNVKIYNAAITKLLQESNDVDEQYDLETLHGMLSKKQAFWANKIKEDLESLQQYKKVKRVIKAAGKKNG